MSIGLITTSFSYIDHKYVAVWSASLAHVTINIKKKLKQKSQRTLYSKSVTSPNSMKAVQREPKDWRKGFVERLREWWLFKVETGIESLRLR